MIRWKRAICTQINNMLRLVHVARAKFTVGRNPPTTGSKSEGASESELREQQAMCFPEIKSRDLWDEGNENLFDSGVFVLESMGVPAEPRGDLGEPRLDRDDTDGRFG